jgi:ankyrin repeat protein
MLNLLLQFQAPGVSLNLNQIEKTQYLAPMHVAAKCGNVEAIRCLRSAGASADIWDSDKIAKPIHLAAISGRYCAVFELTQAGAKISQPNYAGLTPLHLAAREGHIKVMDVLLKLGADQFLQDDEQ